MDARTQYFKSNLTGVTRMEKLRRLRGRESFIKEKIEKLKT